MDKIYRFAEVEARHYDNWERAGAFGCAATRGEDLNTSGDPYTIVIPPPNVTGSLHVGHALDNTLQDILIRFARMRGRDALWQPGTDHAGIATQIVVERQLAEEGITRHDLGREAFIERVWSWKKDSGGTITSQLRRLGASCDWDRERFTMDDGLSRAVREVFVTLHKQGLIYRDKRLVNWDPKLHTAISDLEVEQREIKGFLWYFKYPIECMENTFITVATTRPETMLGDTAVAVHPDDDRYHKLVGQYVLLPISGRRIPIIADEYTVPDKGSGAVKITPAHDFNDFEVGRRHALEMVSIFDENAILNDQVPINYQGMDRVTARKSVVEEMETLGLLEKIEDNPMTVPYGDRSGEVIEPRLTDQWFVEASKLAKSAIEAVEQGRIRFVPEHWSRTYFEWMRNIQPWCISRQIWWGHRIPAWYGPDGEIFVEMDDDVAHEVAATHYGRAVELVRDDDVLDTWFSSALWPFSTLGWPDQTDELERYYPTDVLVTGFDIIFFWVARMIMMGLHILNEVPFHTVYIHALVRDDRGQKMSKSKGNVLDPLELIEQYGADALRFTLTALAAQGRDIKLSTGRIEGYRNFVTKIWNASRYAKLNRCAAVKNFDPLASDLTVNRWIGGELSTTNKLVVEAFESYRFNEAAQALYHFVWHTFCDWYLEFTKPILTEGTAEAQAEVRATTGWALEVIIRMLHPIMPFVTEELWAQFKPENVGHSHLLIETSWPTFSTDLTDETAKAELDWVVRLISEVRAVRSEMHVPQSARLTMLVKGASADQFEGLAVHKELIMRLARLAAVEPADGALPEGSVQAVVDGTTYILPLGEFIDIAKERERLAREIIKLDSEIDRITKKLGNENFISRAPLHVVEEQRVRCAAFEQSRDKVSEALARLASV